MLNLEKSKIRTDEATIGDLLSFDIYRDILVDIIREAETPLTIGIFGSWGAGKTSLLMMLENELKSDMTPVIFNAWQYSKEDALWRALMSRVLEALRPPVTKENEETNKRLNDLQASLYREVDREELGGFTLDWSQLAKGGLKGALKFGLSYIPGVNLVDDLVTAAQEDTKTWAKDILDAFQRERTRIHVDHVQFIEQFQREFQQLVTDYTEKRKSRFIVFVDDLDRCLPEKAIDMLEAIKVFLEAEGCVFVIAVDPNVIIEGIRVKYRDFALREGGKAEMPITGDDYLEKIIQLPFYLPPVTHDDMVKFIGTQMEDLPEDCAEVFALGMETNPRKIKRTLNVFWMHSKVASLRENLKDKIQPVRLAKVVVIQNRYPDLYRELVNAPLLLRDLERYFVSPPEQTQPSTQQQQDTATQKMLGLQDLPAQTEPGQQTKRLVEEWSTKHYLRRMLLFKADDPDLNFADLEQSDLENYIYLTSTSVSTPSDYSDERTWDNLLSGDPTLIESAVGRIPADEKQDYATRLLTVISEGNRSEDERLSAGNALSFVGDPRFNPDHWYLPNEPLLGFVEIKEGTFVMGSDPQQDKIFEENEQAQRKLSLPMFYIARYPVTLAQYNTFIQDSGHEPHEYSLSPNLLGYSNYPAAFIRQQDAISYCQWLEAKLLEWKDLPDTLSKRLRNEGWRLVLPSEAEWEKAARGTDGRIYPWGSRFEHEYANLDNYSIRYASPVGCYPAGASPYGILDMSGNVWEYTRSSWESNDDIQDGYDDINRSKPLVQRGGSYAEAPEMGQCASRRSAFPESSGADGFRVAISPPLETHRLEDSQ